MRQQPAMQISIVVVVAFALLLSVAISGVSANHDCDAERGVCLHGGICSDQVALGANNPGPSGNGWLQPWCVCTSPWGGQDCSYKIRECKDNPCTNGGTCRAASCRQINNNFAEFDCFACDCAPGWTGAPIYRLTAFNPGGICDWPQPIGDCTVVSCANGGTCTSVNTASSSSYTCNCPGGYSGQNCTDVFDCARSQTCLNGGTCVVDVNGIGVSCTCDGFYGGPRCAAQWCDSDPCQHGGSCFNTGNGIGVCQCTSTWAGDFCERATFCSSNPCQFGGTCVDDGNGDGHCDCIPPHDGLLACNGTAFCASSPCQNGAVCLNTTSLQGGTGRCTQCPAKQWRGELCDIPLVGCAVAGCAPGNSRSVIGNLQCRCYDQQSCTVAGQGFGDTRCSCQRGPETGHLDYGYHYDCRCNSTYIPKCPNARTAGIAVTGASVNPVCQNGGTCVEWADGSGCQCRPGFWGDRCQNYDNPCWNEPCKNGGRCTIYQDIVSADRLMFDDRYWGYQCNCRWPYYGKDCEKTSPVPVECPANQCQNGGTCRPRNYDPLQGYIQVIDGIAVQAEPYQCVCTNDFTGLLCETAIVRCSPSSCMNGGFCVMGSQKFTCNCPCGYSGPRCEYQATNVDAISVANFASDGRGGVGYRLDFCNLGMCQNNANCVHTLDGQGFTCQCRSGWSGLLCTDRVRSAASGVTPSAITAILVAAMAIFGVAH